MPIFATAESQCLDAQDASDALAEGVARVLGGVEPGGGLVLASAAAGDGGLAVGRALARRWPRAELAGTSFEGLVSGGRVHRGRPAFAVLAWAAGPAAKAGSGPAPRLLVVEPGEDATPVQLRHALLDGLPSLRCAPGDRVLLFPDAAAMPPVEHWLESLAEAFAPARLLGAAASGQAGAPPSTWLGDEPLPGAGLLVWLPGAAGDDHVRVATGSRLQGPWLEVTACRPHWIDALGGEPALARVRRALRWPRGHSASALLERLLIRVRPGAAPDGTGVPIERYAIGLDEARGAVGVPLEVRRGDAVGLALPDADWARGELERAVVELAPGGTLLQFGCCARDESLHGDEDLEAAWVSARAGSRPVLGTVGPFQLGPAGPDDKTAVLVHATVLTRL